MATYAPLLLSGSTDGCPILIAATATAGTLIHTAVSGSVSWDEVFLWAVNTDTSARNLTIEYGGATVGFWLARTMVLQPNSPAMLVCPGLRLNNGKVIRAFASTTNVVNIVGNVNRIT